MHSRFEPQDQLSSALAAATLGVGHATHERILKLGADVTKKAGVPRICVPVAAITKDALAVRIDKQTGRVVICPMEDFRKVVEINMIAPIYWAMELVAAVAKHRASQGLKRWQPEEGV